MKYCTSSGTLEIYYSNSNAGGIVWKNESEGKILYCVNNMNITADNMVGGMCKNNLGVVKSCSNNGVLACKSSSGTKGDLVAEGKAAEN